MADLRINIDNAVATSNNLKRLNTQIRDAFPGVQTAINRLNNSWDGPAASKTIAKFSEIKEKYAEARYNVVDNYVRFLLQQVGEGYTQTEEANTSLADAFK